MLFGGLLVGEEMKLAPEQLVNVCVGITGVGLTVRTTWKGKPAQPPPPADGVTVYVNVLVCEVVF